MRFFTMLRLRLRSLLSRRRLDAELDEELQYHLDRQIEIELAAGKPPAEARHEALRSIRDLEQRKQECRDARAVSSINNLLQDLHYGLRLLLKRPAFTTVAILTLALGIGANTAVFSAVYALLIRPLPYRDSNRLVVAATILKRYNTDRANLAYADYLDLKRQTPVFDSVAVHFEQPADMTGGEYPERVRTSLVSTDYFRVMGPSPLAGRVFTPAESASTQAHVAVLSYAFWMRRFGADRSVIQHTIELGGMPTQIIGIMPPQSTWPDSTDIFLPLGIGDNPPPAIARRDSFSIGGIARLNDGISIRLAQAQVDALSERIEHDYPALRAGTGLRLYSLSSWIIGPQLKEMVLVMFGAAGLVLAIACTNLANLLLARGISRSQEFAVRLALGARWRRLAGQVVTEQVLLTIVGAITGALFGVAGVRGLAQFAPPDTPRLNELAPNAIPFLITGVVASLTVLIFATVSALHAARTNPADALREDGRGPSPSVRTGRLRALIVTSEVALSMVLLVATGLLIQSFENLNHVKLGFRPENITKFELSLPGSRYSNPQQMATAFARIRDAIRHVPGVLEVGATGAVPAGGGGFYVGKSFVAVGGTETSTANATPGAWDVVLPGYFQTLGIRCLAGRLFDASDTQPGRPVVILSASLASRLFPHESPIGRRVMTWHDESFARQVVGVVSDTPYYALGERNSDVAYVSEGQQSWSTLEFVIRSDVSQASLVPSLRAAVASEDDHVAVTEIEAMNDVVAKSLARPRFLMLLLLIFAAVAVILAGIGLYGVLSYTVGQRTREIGIRIALGARRTEIVWLLTWQGLVLISCGIASGTVIGMGVTKVLAGLLFGIKPRDPATFISAALFLMMIGLVACLLPIRRATHVQPVQALRYQ